MWRTHSRRWRAIGRRVCLCTGHVRPVCRPCYNSNCCSCEPAGIALAVASLAVGAAYAARLVLYNTPGAGVAARAAAVIASSSFTERLAGTLSAAATGTGLLWWLLPLSGVALAAGAAWMYLRVYRGLKQWERENVYFRDYDLRYGPDHRPALPA